ncbi:tetratricopeptide repeat protein [Mesorhizobium australicum]|uniref:tetratricopeptide repeat protein n=1 Tax=Mesorhizobium australicum TaxID=536018 RepID=UPI003339FDB7
MRGAWAVGMFLAVAGVNHCFAGGEVYDLCKRATGSLDQRIDACTRIILDNGETKTNRQAAYKNRGNSWAETGNWDSAITDYDYAIELDPKDARIYFNRGLVRSNKGDTDLAIADYDQALKINPKLLEAYGNRGTAWQRKGDYSRAIADYSKAIELDPRAASVYRNRGDVWRGKGEYDKAIADDDQVIQLSPKDYEAYFDRGLAWQEKGDNDRAINDYDRAIALNPKAEKAYNNRGLSWSIKGDQGRAIADYDKALDLDPKYSSAYMHRGIFFFFGGRIDKAEADFSEVVNHSPANPYGAIWLALAQRARNQTANSEVAERNLDMKKWPAPVLKLLDGKLQPAEVISTASSSVEKCEAEFYVGVFDQVSSRRADAMGQYRSATESCPVTFVEYTEARLALQQLGAAP